MRPQPKKIPFTKEGFAKIKARYDLLTARRPDILVRLQAAREMGDLSENGAYHAARFELSSLDRELRKLTYLVRMGRITQASHTGSVAFGSQVQLTGGLKGISFLLVNEHESNPSEFKFSEKSPLGQAVLGKKVGDKVTVNAPDGPINYTITKVE
jgi:transcription elongation factor GreA